jgi:hypothetical protein
VRISSGCATKLMNLKSITFNCTSDTLMQCVNEILLQNFNPQKLKKGFPIIYILQSADICNSLFLCMFKDRCHHATKHFLFSSCFETEI